MFENLVVLEALKARYNRATTPGLYFFRDGHGNEIDLLHKSGNELIGIEIKAAATWNSAFKKNLLRFSENCQQLARSYVVYSGDELRFSDGVRAVPYVNASEAIFSPTSLPVSTA